MWKPTLVGCQGRPHSWSLGALGFFHFPSLSVSVDVGLQWQTSRHTCWHSPKQKLNICESFLSQSHEFPACFRNRNKSNTTNKGRWAILCVFIWRAIWLWRFYQCPLFKEKIAVCFLPKRMMDPFVFFQVEMGTETLSCHMDYPRPKKSRPSLECCQANWARLPNVVLHEIFCYLGQKDRINASSVCRSWRHVLYHPL